MIQDCKPVRRTLISVSDKTNLLELARALTDLNIEIISTGGTAKTLREAEINVRDVSDLTGFPEMMDGRVKTLHPKIHGGLLAVRDNENHIEAAHAHGIEMIDLLVINLYPFRETIAKPDVALEQAIENIDIGGPAMIRSAAKNFRDVAVVTSPASYSTIIQQLEANNASLDYQTRFQLAHQAFTHTADYDTRIKDYLFAQLASLNEKAKEKDKFDARDENPKIDSQKTESGTDNNSSFILPTSSFASSPLHSNLNLNLHLKSSLRYGENPHQQAALYVSNDNQNGIANAEVLHGKEMSYNNYLDADAAWNLVNDFTKTACAIIKHTNPSGAAVHVNQLEAYRRALACDPVSAFGGIVAFNQTLSQETARAVIEIFTEVIIAPDYEDTALEILKSKKNLRVLKIKALQTSTADSSTASTADASVKDLSTLNEIQLRHISGGYLAQTLDAHRLDASQLKIVSARQPDEREVKDLLFAWRICKHTKSNAIVYARDLQTVGIGAGQMSRIDSVRLGAERAILEIKNTVLASDAFFPFRDGIDHAAKYGITACIQPGGSIKDAEVISACNEHNIAMVLTGIRHFKH